MNPGSRWQHKFPVLPKNIAAEALRTMGHGVPSFHALGLPADLVLRVDQDSQGINTSWAGQQPRQPCHAAHSECKWREGKAALTLSHAPSRGSASGHPWPPWVLGLRNIPACECGAWGPGTRVLAPWQNPCSRHTFPFLPRSPRGWGPRGE